MTTLILTSDGLRIGDVHVAIPGATPSEISALLKAEARTTEGARPGAHVGREWKFPKGKPVNNCAFCSKSKPALVHTIAIDLGEPSASLFSPKSVFTGTLNWEAETFVCEGDAAKALRFAKIELRVLLLGEMGDGLKQTIHRGARELQLSLCERVEVVIANRLKHPLCPQFHQRLTQSIEAARRLAHTRTRSLKRIRCTTRDCLLGIHLKRRGLLLKRGWQALQVEVHLRCPKARRGLLG